MSPIEAIPALPSPEGFTWPLPQRASLREIVTAAIGSTWDAMAEAAESPDRQVPYC